MLTGSGGVIATTWGLGNEGRADEISQLRKVTLLFPSFLCSKR